MKLDYLKERDEDFRRAYKEALRDLWEGGEKMTQRKAITIALTKQPLRYYTSVEETMKNYKYYRRGKLAERITNALTFRKYSELFKEFDKQPRRHWLPVRKDFERLLEFAKPKRFYIGYYAAYEIIAGRRKYDK